MEELTLDELKNQAKELGIKYSPNIGAEALQKKIAEASAEPVQKPHEEVPTVNNDIPTDDDTYLWRINRG